VWDLALSPAALAERVATTTATRRHRHTDMVNMRCKRRGACVIEKPANAVLSPHYCLHCEERVMIGSLRA